MFKSRDKIVNKLLGCKCFVQSLYLLNPCLGDEQRNQTLPLQLGHFSWLCSITTGLRPPANHPLNMEPALLLFFLKPAPFAPPVWFPNSPFQTISGNKVFDLIAVSVLPGLLDCPGAGARVRSAHPAPARPGPGPPGPEGGGGGPGRRPGDAGQPHRRGHVHHAQAQVRLSKSNTSTSRVVQFNHRDLIKRKTPSKRWADGARKRLKKASLFQQQRQVHRPPPPLLHPVPLLLLPVPLRRRHGFASHGKVPLRPKNGKRKYLFIF